MRKVLIISFAVLSIFLVGCGKFHKNKPKISKEIQIENFYFEASETGLVLKNSSLPNFTENLSTNPIIKANISDNILQFTEIIDENPNTQIFNLKSIVDNY